MRFARRVRRLKQHHHLKSLKRLFIVHVCSNLWYHWGLIVLCNVTVQRLFTIKKVAIHVVYIINQLKRDQTPRKVKTSW
jgi:hypothetical protein